MANFLSDIRAKASRTQVQLDTLSESISPIQAALALTESAIAGHVQDYDVLVEGTTAIMNESATPEQINEGIADSFLKTIQNIWEKIVKFVKGIGAKITQMVDQMRLSGQQLANKKEYVTMIRNKNYKEFEYQGFEFVEITTSKWPLFDVATFISNELKLTPDDANSIGGTGSEKEQEDAIAKFRKDKLEKLADASVETQKHKTAYFKKVTSIGASEKMDATKMREEMFKDLRGGKSAEKTLKGLDVDALVKRLQNPVDLEAIQEQYRKLSDDVDKSKDVFEEAAKKAEADASKSANASDTKRLSLKSDYIKKLSSFYESILSVASIITDGKLEAAKARVAQDTMLFKKAMAYKHKKDNNSFEDMDIDFIGELEMMMAD